MVVMKALETDIYKDYRVELNQQPIFKKGLLSVRDFKVGSPVTGNLRFIFRFIPAEIFTNDLLLFQVRSQTLSISVHLWISVWSAMSFYIPVRWKVPFWMSEIVYRDTSRKWIWELYALTWVWQRFSSDNDDEPTASVYWIVGIVSSQAGGGTNSQLECLRLG